MSTKSLFVMALLALVSYGLADVPSVINYQGYLTDSGGQPVDDDTYFIKFKIYGSSSGDDSLWWSGFQPVPVANGFFNYMLGSAVPLPDDLFTGPERYLGITVGGDPEISPRIQFSSSGFTHQALRSDITDYAEDVADGCVTTDKMALLSVTYDRIANGAVGATKISPDAVESSHILNESIQFEDIGSNGAATNQIMKWNGSAWAAADDETGAGGDITAVYASTGLDGGAESGDATLSIADLGVGNLQLANNAVSGSKIQENAVYSDHIMDGQVYTADLNNDAVTTDKIQNNTIIDADINSTANIAVSKIAGTAVNLSSTQTIEGDKTFDGNVNFGDSTMWINNDGVAIGDASPPSAYYLLRVSRNYVNSANSNWGVFASVQNKEGTGNSYAIRANSFDSLGIAYGVRTSAYSDNLRFGVYALATDDGADTSASYGVYGQASDGEFAYGIYGTASGATSENWAGYFSGNVRVTGVLDNSKSSIIMDHPLDPENKYLRHSTVGSPEMMNVYSGNVTLDADGEAIVTLPDYFEAANENYRYQLTPVGGAAPNLHIAEEISGNRFLIAGGKPFMKVSWQVSGVRSDTYAKSNPLEVEVEKSNRERGLYINPEAFGYGAEQHVDYENNHVGDLEEERSE